MDRQKDIQQTKPVNQKRTAGRKKGDDNRNRGGIDRIERKGEPWLLSTKRRRCEAPPCPFKAGRDFPFGPEPAFGKEREERARGREQNVPGWKERVALLHLRIVPSSADGRVFQVCTGPRSTGCRSSCAHLHFWRCSRQRLVSVEKK